MKHKPQNEDWFEFMDRAKKNGLSPTKQEEVDRQKTTNNKIQWTATTRNPRAKCEK